MKLKLQTRRLCLALAAAAVLAGGWLAIQAAPKPQAADTPAVQTAASAAAPVRTGALAASIKAGAVKYSAADGYYCEVAPTDTNAEGENLAKIGNILEYGRSNMPARPWFVPTVDSAVEEVNSAIRDAFQAAQGKD